MPRSCKVILKSMVYKGAMTQKDCDKIVRNLKPQIEKEDAIAYLHQIRWLQAHDKEIYKQGYECGKNERKTGQWIPDQFCVHKPSRIRNTDRWTIYHCSCCGHSNGRRFNDKFCPKCGAKMILKTQGGDSDG